jgi:DNA (cytosine-5)-methyltransferase 1
VGIFFKHIGLFEGIGGFSLAAELMNWETTAWCEVNPFCQRILKYHFPKSIPHEDIRKTDFTIYRGAIDIITGGFPCQPFSQSGAQKGENDERYLFPEMFRAIREIKAPWIVAENVYGITTRKFREVFETICSSLEAEGYEVQPVIIPASVVGAPHERDRVWFVAYNSNARFENMRQKWQNSIYRSGFITNSDKLNGDLSGFYTSGFSQFEKAGIFQNNVTDTKEQRFSERDAKKIGE